jgi:type II secretion system GspH-like protein
MSFAEATVALALIALMAAGGASVLAPTLRSLRLSSAARDMALALQRVRGEAIARGGSVGIAFEREPDAWRIHEDGGAPGILRAETTSHVDPPLSPRIAMAALHPGIRFGLPEGHSVPRIPPSIGTIDPDDPITFGSTDIFSASPTGATSSGSIYLTDGRDVRAIVVHGPTGRLRIWSHDSSTNQWSEAAPGGTR